ncbi:hypothetical protein BG015_001501 [Linnemannia schmuckeri]|uniref:Galactose oxidase n=1 Tax=Linnemannia schmuckeri TaxID=64567 RepID=A0A9P5V708_9FUNG|nr:hypothetical protein BG015_001501 [Linnemannia schmuckeri]
MSYSLDTKKWAKVADRPKELTTQPGIQTVAHPTTGLVYIPSGRNNPDGDMMIYDLMTATIKWAPMPPREPGNALQWFGYSFVWSNYRNSFLIFGGGGDVGSYFYEYKLADNAWNELALQGVIPPRVKNACFTPAYNGTKMILFGGQLSNGTALGSLYTLDMELMIWSLTQTTPASQNRHSMACSVSGDNFIIWGGQSTTGTVMSGTPLIYNINTTKWTTQFVRGTSFTPTGPLTARNTDTSESETSTDVGAAIVAGAVAIAFVGFLFYRRRKRQRALKQGGHFVQMPESDMNLTHIVSPPPLPGTPTSGQGSITELNGGRQRLHGSHSNSQPITLAGHHIDDNNNALSNNYDHNDNNYNANNADSNYNIHNHSVNNDLDSRSLPLPPISAISPTNPSWSPPPTDPSWSTPPQNPSWPTGEQPFCPPHHLQATLSSPSSSPSWASMIPSSNSPSAPPPPYLTSAASSPVVVFRKEAMTEPVPVPVPPIKEEAMTGSLPVHTFSGNYNNHNNSGNSSSTIEGYAIHERQVEELQHQLAARKEELVRRNSGLRPQYYPPPPPVVSGGSGGYTASKAVARSPQGAGDIVVQETGTIGNSSSSSGVVGSEGTSNEELQQQVQALQAELNRLQALIGL